jgi:transcriptional pleiotropic repressor
MEQLLAKTRKINQIIQKSTVRAISFGEIASTLCEILEANVYILDSKGKITGHCFTENYSCDIMKDIVKNGGHYPDDFNSDLLRMEETQVNVTRENQCIFNDDPCLLKNKYNTIVPIIGGGERLGTLMLSKGSTFSSADLVLVEFSATVIGMEVLRMQVEKIEQSARQKAVVSIAFDTLSFSELEAVEHIFAELNGTNGLLVASKIADKVGITRSVIVNALRKLESAGVIEVRSLGMKGTYIRVLNDYLMEELEKIRVAHKRY